MHRRLILLGALLMVLSSCSLLPAKKVDTLHLMAPDEGPPAAVIQQTLTLISQGKEHSFLVALQLTALQIKLRVMLPTGQLIYSLNYDGDKLTQSNLSDTALPAEEILAMLQFSLWPAEVVKKYYKPADGWQVAIDADQRILTYAADKRLSVEYLADNNMLIKHHTHQYQVRIKTLEYKAL